MTTFTANQFRLDFPEFADATVYPDSQINFWATVAASMVNTERWAEFSNLGVELVTAHHIVMAAASSANAAAAPGATTGPIASKSVDKLSKSYDTKAYLMEGASFWNMTTYGLRYLYYLRLFGAGGLQL